MRASEIKQNEKLIKFLYNAKLEMGLSYDELSHLTKMESGKICQILKHKRDPKFRHIVKIAKAMNIDIKYLATLVEG